MSTLSLFLLGPPRLERDGEAIKLNNRKAIALLAYLAITGRSHSRDSLINLFWPDYDCSRARTLLSTNLYVLNKAFKSDWLDADRETVGLSPSADLWIDILRFNNLLRGCRAHGHPSS